MLTIEQAQYELNIAVQNNPGPWEQHSLAAADNARRIAEKVPGMDPEKAYVMGLYKEAVYKRQFHLRLLHRYNKENHIQIAGYDM